MRPRNFGLQFLKRGWRVAYILADTLENRDASLDGAEMVRIPRSSNAAYVAAVRGELDRIRPDFVHFLNPSLKAWRIARSGLTCKTIADWEDWHVVCKFNLLQKVIIRYVDAWHRRHADVVTVCSKWLQTQFNKLGRKQVHYIPYAPLPEPIPDRPSPFTEPTAAFVGGFNPQWDQKIIVEAAILLKRRGKMPPIRMIGKGPELEPLRALAKKNGLTNIEMPGYLDWAEMLSNLHHAHVLLFPIQDRPANWARCPFKVFNYAQAARPIITCKIGEVYQTLGDKATYVACTPEAFADAIDKAMSEPRQDDIDYELYNQTWEERAERLMHAMQV